ncbi:MAG: hypothetical protein ABIG94_03835 [Pseudomonadota bacterium]
MRQREGEEMEARLALMKSRIAELRQRLKEAEEEVKAELERQVDLVPGQAEAERQKLQDLKDLGFEKWETIKRQAEKAWEELEKSLGKIASRLKK